MRSHLVVAAVDRTKEYGFSIANAPIYICRPPRPRSQGRYNPCALQKARTCFCVARFVVPGVLRNNGSAIIENLNRCSVIAGALWDARRPRGEALL